VVAEVEEKLACAREVRGLANVVGWRAAG